MIDIKTYVDRILGTKPKKIEIPDEQLYKELNERPFSVLENIVSIEQDTTITPVITEIYCEYRGKKYTFTISDIQVTA